MVFLARYWRRLGQLPWTLPVLLIAGIFLSSWLLMALVEPGSDLTAPDAYWWYFLVTSTTVGYGDFFPTTALGRLVGGYVAVGGIVTLTLIFARVSTALENARSLHMLGISHLRHSGHVVIIGHAPGRTERIVRTLLADDPERRVVVCAWEEETDRHPMPAEEQVDFVRGDLTSTDTLARAAVREAHAVLVDARTDDEAVTLLLALDTALEGDQDTHLVVTLRDLDRRRTVRRVSATAHCVQWHSVGMIVEELVDPGLALVYQDLMNPEGHGTFSTVVPEGATRSYGEWQQALGSRLGATLLAVGRAREVAVSPAWDTAVEPGSVLYYIAGARLSGPELAGL